MSFAPAFESLRSFSARKKVGRSASFGFGRRGHGRFGDSSRLAGVYQKRIAGGRSYTVRMRYYRPTNPQSVPQQANRAKFSAAMSAWGGLTAGEKSAYNERAKKRQMFGWGLFIREYYQAN